MLPEDAENQQRVKNEDPCSKDFSAAKPHRGNKIKINRQFKDGGYIQDNDARENTRKTIPWLKETEYMISNM